MATPDFYIARQRFFVHGDQPYWDLRNADGRKVGLFRTKAAARAYANKLKDGAVIDADA